MSEPSSFRPRPDQANSVDLSVLFVTRNEERRIEACIRSTMAAVETAKRTSAIRSAEFLLVDSASTDRTIEIASRFPVRIVQLGSDWPLSCGAGCFVGLELVRGRFCAIINGDMVIDPEWFVSAVPYLEEDVAGVLGLAIETLSGSTYVERLLLRHGVPATLDESGQTPERDATTVLSPGTFLVRTDAVRRVGSYNPFFSAAEDVDLRLRLVRAGWKVIDIPVIQGTHFWAEEGMHVDIGEYARTTLRNSIGLGQMTRYNLPQDAWVARRAGQQVLSARTLMNLLLAMGMTCIALITLLALATYRFETLAAGLVTDFTALSILAEEARRRRLSIREYGFEVIFLPLVFCILRTTGFVRGLSMTPRGPDDYPRGLHAPQE